MVNVIFYGIYNHNKAKAHQRKKNPKKKKENTQLLGGKNVAAPMEKSLKFPQRNKEIGSWTEDTISTRLSSTLSAFSV